MKRIIFLGMVFSLGATQSVNAMMPMTADEKDAAVKICIEYPYICYPLMAGQIICCTIILGGAIKHYCGPAFSSCFSCCSSKKRERDKLLDSGILEAETSDFRELPHARSSKKTLQNLPLTTSLRKNTPLPLEGKK